MDLLTRVYVPGEADVDFCHVEVTPEIAEDLIKKIELTKYLKKRDKAYLNSTFVDYLPRFYTTSSLTDMGMDEEFLDKVSDAGDWLELDDDQTQKISVAVDTRVDSEQVIVWPDDDVVWSAWYGDNMRVESSTLGRRIFERIAIEHPKYLMKALAFGYEIPV